MNWRILSRLALLGLFGMVTWMVFPICTCAFSSPDEEQGGDPAETTFHDWAYGDDRADESDEQGTARSLPDRISICYAETPIHKNDRWKLGLTGGLFVGWIVFRRLDRAQWVRDVTGVHRKE